MFEEILKLDSKLFLFLNNLGTTKFDAFWLSLSKIEANILMYLFLIFLLFFIQNFRPKFLNILLINAIDCVEKSSSEAVISINRLHCSKVSIKPNFSIRVLSRGHIFWLFLYSAAKSKRKRGPCVIW